MTETELKALRQAIQEVCDEETNKKIMERKQILQEKYDKGITYPQVSFGDNEIILSREVLQDDINNLGFKRHKEKGYWYRKYDHNIVKKLESIFGIDLTGF